MNFAPLARIALRYVVGGVFMGSQEVGEKLAADPDVVMVSALAIGVAVEVAYWLAKKFGWST